MGMPGSGTASILRYHGGPASVLLLCVALLGKRPRRRGANDAHVKLHGGYGCSHCGPSHDSGVGSRCQRPFDRPFCAAAQHRGTPLWRTTTKNAQTQIGQDMQNLRGGL